MTRINISYPRSPGDLVNAAFHNEILEAIKQATKEIKVGGIALGVGSVGNSTLVDIASTTQGVAFPRMTTTQRNAISAPATGLCIYNTTTKFFEYYHSGAWRTFSDYVEVLGGLTTIHDTPTNSNLAAYQFDGSLRANSPVDNSDAVTKSYAEAYQVGTYRHTLDSRTFQITATALSTTGSEPLAYDICSNSSGLYAVALFASNTIKVFKSTDGKTWSEVHSVALGFSVVNGILKINTSSDGYLAVSCVQDRGSKDLLCIPYSPISDTWGSVFTVHTISSGLLTGAVGVANTGLYKAVYSEATTGNLRTALSSDGGTWGSHQTILNGPGNMIALDIAVLDNNNWGVLSYNQGNFRLHYTNNNGTGFTTTVLVGSATNSEGSSVGYGGLAVHSSTNYAAIMIPKYGSTHNVAVMPNTNNLGSLFTVDTFTSDSLSRVSIAARGILTWVGFHNPTANRGSFAIVNNALSWWQRVDIPAYTTKFPAVASHSDSVIGGVAYNSPSAGFRAGIMYPVAFSS